MEGLGFRGLGSRVSRACLLPRTMNPKPNPQCSDKHAKRLDKVLRDAKLADLLMRADEHPKGSPFDHYTKLQAFVSKGKTEEGIRWVFCAACLIFNMFHVLTLLCPS